MGQKWNFWKAILVMLKADGWRVVNRGLFDEGIENEDAGIFMWEPCYGFRSLESRERVYVTPLPLWLVFHLVAGFRYSTTLRRDKVKP